MIKKIKEALLMGISKKTFQLISAVVGGLETIAVGIVTFVNPESAAAINAAIVIVGTAIIEAGSQFVTEK